MRISLASPTAAAFLVIMASQLPHRHFRGLHDVHFVTAHTLRFPPYRGIFLKCFRPFVASWPAPSTSGRSERGRVGISPTELVHLSQGTHNNRCENAIRPFVVGRKGWLFSDTVKGAVASANLYSLVETCLCRVRHRAETRLVPVHHTTRSILRRYAAQRDTRLDPPKSAYFFVGARGGQLLLQNVYAVFWRLSRQTGLRAPSAHHGPRLHDFRHRFAVQTLLNGYRSGEPVELILPVLSTYLGHGCIRDTYWYLSACPELLGHAASRLENRREHKP